MFRGGDPYDVKIRDVGLQKLLNQFSGKKSKPTTRTVQTKTSKSLKNTNVNSRSSAYSNSMSTIRSTRTSETRSTKPELYVQRVNQPISRNIKNKERAIDELMKLYTLRDFLHEILTQQPRINHVKSKYGSLVQQNEIYRKINQSFNEYDQYLRDVNETIRKIQLRFVPESRNLALITNMRNRHMPSINSNNGKKYPYLSINEIEKVKSDVNEYISKFINAGKNGKVMKLTYDPNAPQKSVVENINEQLEFVNGLLRKSVSNLQTHSNISSLTE